MAEVPTSLDPAPEPTPVTLAYHAPEPPREQVRSVVYIRADGRGSRVVEERRLVLPGATVPARWGATVLAVALVGLMGVFVAAGHRDLFRYAPALVATAAGLAAAVLVAVGVIGTHSGRGQ